MRRGEYLDFFGAAFGNPSPGSIEAHRRGFAKTAGANTFKDLYVESLSHGMKQRVALARTLLHDPPRSDPR